MKSQEHRRICNDVMGVHHIIIGPSPSPSLSCNPRSLPPQTNCGLRVLRLRGAHQLTLRAMRAAGEMLRRNTTLQELDLVNSTFLALAVPDSITATACTSTATLLQTSHSATSQPPTPAPADTLPPLPLRLKCSSLSSLPSSSRLQHLPHPHAHVHHQYDNERQHTTETSTGVVATAVAPSLRRNSSFASGSSRGQSVGGLTGFGGVAATGGAGGAGCSAAELDVDSWEMMGVMWSAMAGGLAVNGQLRVLRLSYCGLGAVGVAALAPALLQVRHCCYCCCCWDSVTVALFV